MARWMSRYVVTEFTRRPAAATMASVVTRAFPSTTIESIGGGRGGGTGSCADAPRPSVVSNTSGARQRHSSPRPRTGAVRRPSG